jgi:hypothetical protein
MMRKHVINRLAYLLAMVFMVMAPAYAGNDAQPLVYGKSFGEWSVKWWQWVEAQDWVPMSESGAIDCSKGQQGSVWFLAGSMGGTPADPPIERTCTVHSGQGLFFPLVNLYYFNDVSIGENVSVAEKRAVLDGYMSPNDDDAVPEIRPCNMAAIVDGTSVVITGSEIVRAQSPTFMLVGDPQAVSDGYWALLNLPKGAHTLQIKGGYCENNIQTFAVNVIYHLTVTGNSGNPGNRLGDVLFKK